MLRYYAAPPPASAQCSTAGSGTDYGPERPPLRVVNNPSAEGINFQCNGMSSTALRLHVSCYLTAPESWALGSTPGLASAPADHAAAGYPLSSTSSGSFGPQPSFLPQCASADDYRPDALPASRISHSPVDPPRNSTIPSGAKRTRRRLQKTPPSEHRKTKMSSVKESTAKTTFVNPWLGAARLFARPFSSAPRCKKTSRMWPSDPLEEVYTTVGEFDSLEDYLKPKAPVRTRRRDRLCSWFRSSRVESKAKTDKAIPSIPATTACPITQQRDLPLLGPTESATSTTGRDTLHCLMPPPQSVCSPVLRSAHTPNGRVIAATLLRHVTPSSPRPILPISSMRRRRSSVDSTISYVPLHNHPSKLNVTQRLTKKTERPRWNDDRRAFRTERKDTARSLGKLPDRFESQDLGETLATASTLHLPRPQDLEGSQSDGSSDVETEWNYELLPGGLSRQGTDYSGSTKQDSEIASEESPSRRSSTRIRPATKLGSLVRRLTGRSSAVTVATSIPRQSRDPSPIRTEFDKEIGRPISLVSTNGSIASEAPSLPELDFCREDTSNTFFAPMRTAVRC
jgi:hypothetical protein